MKVLLLNPPAENVVIEYPDEEGDAYLESHDFGCFPPLGLLYVLTYLERNTTGHEITFLDCIGEKVSHKDLPEVIAKINPDIVGITSFTILLVDVCMAARTVRQVAPNSHICLGGHHPIAFPFEAAKLPEFDSIIVGEGELAFTELVNALEQKRDFTDIHGVYTGESIERWKDRSFHDPRFLTNVTVPPGYVENIDLLPAPNRNYIKHINYQSVVGVSSRLATIISSRGCPYRCTFCDVPFKKYRGRSIPLVVDELQECLDMGYDEFHFYDDLFNISPEKVIGFCEEVERRGLKFNWDFRGRVNTATRESLERAKKIGLRMISFGVETGTDEGLRQLRKGTNREQIARVFKWCKELGIKTIADFMIGLPFERSEKDIMDNVNFLIDLGPDYAQFAILTLYPNTQIFDEAEKKGLATYERWKDFSLNPRSGFFVDHWEEHLSIHEMVRIQKKAYRKFYFRPSYILKSIMNIKSFYEFKAKVGGFFKLMQ